MDIELKLIVIASCTLVMGLTIGFMSLYRR
jgi:hypothetical protein